jgi:hypothetical protein
MPASSNCSAERLIDIQIVVEDALSETVLRRLLAPPLGRYRVAACYGKRGCGYIRKKIHGFNQAARTGPYLVLTDLDQAVCPAELRNHWLTAPQSRQLLFHVAVREVESWLLGDKDGLARFLGISPDRVPENPDAIVDPKSALLRLARRSRKRHLREALLPRLGSTAIVGPDYNGTLSEFVLIHWDPLAAARRSESLKRLLDRLAAFCRTVA